MARAAWYWMLSAFAINEFRVKPTDGWFAMMGCGRLYHNNQDGT